MKFIKNNVMVLGLLLQVGMGFAMFERDGQTILGRIDQYHASQPRSELIKAAEKGELKDLERALRDSYNINEMSYDMNPLMHASRRGRVDMAKMLLEKGASPHIQTSWGDNTPLREAVKGGHEAIVKLMLQYTCGGRDVQCSLGYALIQAAQDGRKDLVELLLKGGADVNAQGHPDSDEMPTVSYALIEAAKRGHEDVVGLLLTNGAHVNCESSTTGDTALICAAAKGYVAIVKLLLDHGASTSIQNVWGQTALQIAQQKDNTEIIQLIEQNTQIQVRSA